jgi:predicted ATPase/DNA-binding CsgD family transcriptional regulator
MGPTNLPFQLTSFIGRKRELSEVERLLATSRLVTLTGPGGCGKTRLALQLAGAIRDRYRDGVWLVELASLRDPGLLPQLINNRLGISHDAETPALKALLNHLPSRAMLLLMDNCEHLFADCARLAQQLLAHASELRLLATSREPLSIAGETRYPVSGLSWPMAGADDRVNDPQALLEFDAVRLLVDRARTVQPSFSLTPANAMSVVNICRQLDGLPLALELASARANVLTPQQIAERLNDRCSLLVSSQRAVPCPRHHTLRAAMDWSYELLSTPEQVMLRRLSVVSGGCTLATVEAVCTGGEVERLQGLELLSSLVNKSLVVGETLQANEARYHLLETIRQYAQEKLIAAGEGPALSNRHLEYFLEVTEAAGQKLTGQEQQRWLNWLAGEYDNIRAALAWSLESGRIEAGLRIAIALYQFWTIRNYVAEGLAWMERLLPKAGDQIALVVRANALALASLLASQTGNTSAQVAYGRQAGHLAEAAGDEGKPALIWALVALAHASRAMGDYETEFALAQRVIELRREAGNAYPLGRELYIYSSTAMALGKYDAAQAMLDEALPLLRQAGDSYRIAMALNYRGDLARCQRRYAQAQRAYEESLVLLREIGAMRDAGSVLHNLGHTCLHRGDDERARALFSETLAIHQAEQHKPGMTECLLGFAALAIASDLPAAGARLLAATAALGGQRNASFWVATRLEYQHYVARARSRLTEAEFEAEQAVGRALSLEQAVDDAQQVARQVAAANKDEPKAAALTVRERDIAVRIAQGKSNGEIAAELVLSKRTVEAHIANILSKLGFRNRAQIVRWAIDTGLVKTSE